MNNEDASFMARLVVQELCVAIDEFKQAGLEVLHRQPTRAERRERIATAVLAGLAAYGSRSGAATIACDLADDLLLELDRREAADQPTKGVLEAMQIEDGHPLDSFPRTDRSET